MDMQQIKSRMIQFVQDIGTEEEIGKFYKKYKSENFILPVEMRILSGIMQSISIRQGYLIESILREVISQEPGLVLHKFSGNMKTELVYTKQSVQCINQYIDTHNIQRKTPNLSEYRQFLRSLQRIEADETYPVVESGNYNYDILFYHSRSDSWVILEVKFCDNHDHIKLMQIHQKLFLLYSGILNEISHNASWKKVWPCLYYFNDYKVSRNYYLPEQYIFRGETLFQKYFLTITYTDILSCFQSVKHCSEMQDALHGLQERVKLFVQG